MNKERLNKLADFLDTVPERKFDLDTWRVNADGKEVFDESTDDEQLLNFDCGTSGCAIGWACAMPEFKAQGLTWGLWGPTVPNYDGWDAVMDFFDLKRADATYLFESESYDYDVDEDTKPSDVAARIRELAA